ncbi:MAG: DUF1624 domain-containing protein [Methanomicrobiales archaeon]|nr:DUF1624 domain-containing protein [Methanomicrobiales archaeon]
MTHIRVPLPRYWEIDLFRGIAVLMMILFHTVFDISFFSILPINISSGFWRYFAILTAFIFIFLVGISLNISHHRSSPQIDGSHYTKYLIRGGKILGLGFAITIVTYLVIREGFIVFGVLHCIGASIILAPFFFGKPRIGLLAAFVVLTGGILVTGITGPLWLAWTGIHPASFYTLDYFPLLPWLGVVLLGLTTGTYLYPKGIRQLPLPDRPPTSTGPVCWMGRHSLEIYLVHQPLIILVLALVFPDTIWFLP